MMFKCSLDFTQNKRILPENSTCFLPNADDAEKNNNNDQGELVVEEEGGGI